VKGSAPQLRLEKPCSFVLIDDNPADVRWFELIAKDIGLQCTVRAYWNVPDAIRHLAECDQPCDAIFVTAIPPVLTLQEACAELASVRRLQSVPVIALIEGSHDIEFIRRAGLNRWVQKPVNAAELEHVCTQVRTCSAVQARVN